MFRRLCSKHAQVQKSCSLPCHCARPVLAPSSIYFLHKGRRRPRRGCCVRSNSICSSSNFASNLGLDGPNINFQFRLHSAGALSASSFSDLRSRTAFTATDEESDHIEQNKQTTTKPQHDLLSQQLIFLFSDLNLRNNKHARSILIDDQYLPLKELLEIKSIKNITCDEESGGDPTAMVMDAIDLVNKNESNVQLHMDQFDNGELFVRRSPPFSYSESIKSSHDRMMVIEGWPLENKKSRPRWAVSHVRMLLCNENTIFDKEMRIDANNTPMTYWRYDHAMGVINIEFKSESGALGAWENLERAASSQAAADSPGIEVYRLPPEDKARKAYKLQIGDIALIARSINMTSINDDHNLETGSNKSLVDDQPSIPYQESRVKKIGPVDVLPLTYNKVWETFGTLSLSQFTDAMNQLFQYHVTLPPSVGHDLRDNDLQQQLLSRRHDLYADVLRLVSSFKASVDQGEIRALRGKDGYELSDSLGMALQFFSETPISERPIEDVGGIVGGSMSPYEACLDVFEILSDLNLDIHPSHYTYAIRAACIESRWREAAHLFLSQVDGDDGFNPNATGGYVPIDPELAWEGLYAVACDAKMAEPAGEGVDQCPSKRVFDTAMKMSMISPPGQEKCKSEACH